MSTGCSGGALDLAKTVTDPDPGDVAWQSGEMIHGTVFSRWVFVHIHVAREQSVFTKIIFSLFTEL